MSNVDSFYDARSPSFVLIQNLILGQVTKFPVEKLSTSEGITKNLTGGGGGRNTPLPLRLNPGLHIMMIVMIVSTVTNMSVPSNFDAPEHFDYNIASFTSIVINCSVSCSCSDRSHHLRHVSSLVSSCIANLNQRDMAKQLL